MTAPLMSAPGVAMSPDWVFPVPMLLVRVTPEAGGSGAVQARLGAQGERAPGEGPGRTPVPSTAT